LPFVIERDNRLTVRADFPFGRSADRSDLHAGSGLLGGGELHAGRTGGGLVVVPEQGHHKTERARDVLLGCP
jgi:hypothetical protein